MTTMKTAMIFLSIENCYVSVNHVQKVTPRYDTETGWYYLLYLEGVEKPLQAVPEEIEGYWEWSIPLPR